MKELSIEEKAKAYDEAIKRAREYDFSLTGVCAGDVIEDVFPELKESENERIRKELIKYFSEGIEFLSLIPYNKEECVAWLEKQGVKNFTDRVEPKFYEGDWVFIEDVKGYKNGPFQIKAVDSFGYSFDEYHTIPFMYEELLSKWTIQDAKEGDVLSYVTDEEDLWIMIYWSLYEPYEGHVHYHALLVNNNFSDKGTCCISIDNLNPATKEQRDLLFQKMKEAGYKWDADKRELKKIVVPIFHIGDRVKYKGHACDGVITEITNTDYICGNAKLPISTQDNIELIEQKSAECPQETNPNGGIVCEDFREGDGYYKVNLAYLSKSQVELIENLVASWQNPTNSTVKWSEEDENTRKKIIKFLKEQNYFDGKVNEFKEPYKKEYDWLKSLRPQSQWKPSDEQMKALWEVYKGGEEQAALASLYSDLKKLMEE